MLCPYCLAEVPRFANKKDPGYRCPECKETVPGYYSDQYVEYPPRVFSTVGFRAHGKSVYLASLFFVLKGEELSKHWVKFYYHPTGDETRGTLNASVKDLKQGRLPNQNVSMFPRPTIVHLDGVPTRNKTALLCYDASGESFEKASGIVTYGKFLARSDVVLFLLSIPDLARQGFDVAEEMGRLLHVYQDGIADLHGNTRQQRLVLVYTMADELDALDLPEYGILREHLTAGTFHGVSDYRTYRHSLRSISDHLRTLTEERLHARQFLNNIEANFAGVEFCAVSALGASARDQQLEAAIFPCRVLDPLLWVLDDDLWTRPRTWWPFSEAGIRGNKNP